MADRYQRFTGGAVGGFAARRLGLPRPEVLRRYRPGEPACVGPVETGGCGRLGEELAAVLEAAGAGTWRAGRAEHPGAPETPASPGSLLFDATGVTDTEELTRLYEFFHSRIRTLRRTTPPARRA
jgi:3-oxoacyl-[acyl-carrier protein] reductase